jgi:hypothetical protein
LFRHPGRYALIIHFAGDRVAYAYISKKATASSVVSDLLHRKPGWAQSGAQFNAQDFNTRSVFELVVNDSRVLKVGASKIVTQSAFVTLAHGLIPGNSEGLEIQFFTKRLQKQRSLTY